MEGGGVVNGVIHIEKIWVFWRSGNCQGSSFRPSTTRRIVSLIEVPKPSIGCGVTLGLRG